jgi:hypothetical protein
LHLYQTKPIRNQHEKQVVRKSGNHRKIYHCSTLTARKSFEKEHSKETAAWNAGVNNLQARLVVIPMEATPLQMSLGH